ncbi:hypothetical protein J2W24_006244 [Variovorax boronicumulans]|uniref:hypothetical protein n=1 Tax=Variovorax boronicumulans TaxID=436515 RepID=UPI0027804E83|nr:hypothetical protein [Variovorax boronicumulans]MDP9920562.1 hypothetical protein [Variovorax boronicumulans]
MQAFLDAQLEATLAAMPLHADGRFDCRQSARPAERLLRAAIEPSGRIDPPWRSPLSMIPALPRGKRSLCPNLNAKLHFGLFGFNKLPKQA